MFMNRRTVRIEWGDCDPAGIVFYPRYMAMFDHSTVLLLEAALGLNKHQLYEKYDFDGYPMVETRARFLIPTRYCDEVVIETTVKEVRRTSFHVHHSLMKDGALAVEGFESRVWIVRDKERPGRFKPQAIPAEIVARLHAEIVRALKSPDVRAGLIHAGADPSDITTEQYTAFIQNEFTKWSKVIKAAGIKGE